MNQRLIRILRGCMTAYVRRWRLIRLDPHESAHAAHLLAQAIRLRDRANAWQKAL